MEVDDRRIAEACHRALNTEDGKILHAHIRDVFHAFRSTHCPGDPHESTFREGQRNVTLHLDNLADGSLIGSVEPRERPTRDINSRLLRSQRTTQETT